MSSRIHWLLLHELDPVVEAFDMLHTSSSLLLPRKYQKTPAKTTNRDKTL